MRQIFRNKQFWIGTALALLVAYFVSPYLRAEKYLTYQSPDGRYQLSTYRYPQLFAMPGQAGDAHGYVVLSGPDGKELQRQYLEMVQLVNNPQWSETNVSVKLILSWDLP